MANHDAGEGREGIHYEGGIPVFESPLERIEREQSEAKKGDKLYRDEQLTINRQQLRVNKRLMIFTFLLVLTSLISGVISIYQAGIAKDSANAAKSAAETASQTLTEMKSGSGAQDTHTLAQQAVTQATQTTNLATAADAQATELRESIRQTGRLADAASRSADASNVSNSQSVALFERQNRPWIGVEGEPSFYQGSSPYGNSEIRIEYSIRNFGYSPKPLQEAFQGSGGSYHRVESGWADLLHQGYRIKVTVTDKYRSGENRPYTRSVSWTEFSPANGVTQRALEFVNFTSPQSRARAFR